MPFLLKNRAVTAIKHALRPAGEICKRFAYQSTVTAPIAAVISIVSDQNRLPAADKAQSSLTL